MSAPIDQPVREQALDITQSFIVQAPAGSGKTELLTQRYLALLANANFPEEIIAITFTRKASKEMQDRIINALQYAAKINKARHDHPTEKKPQPQTVALAQAVLARNQERAWRLLENPARFQIKTIDALCNSITQKMPLLSRSGVQPNPTETAHEFYQFAANEVLNSLEYDTPWSDALTTLLLHLDNNYLKVEKLFIEMLARRDQWLPYVAGINDSARLRQILENSLSKAIAETLLHLKDSVPAFLQQEFAALANFAAEQLAAKNNKSPIAACLGLQTLPDIHAENLPAWQGLAQLLLTGDNGWRKKIDISIGFPPKTAGKTPAEKSLFEEMKQRMQNLVEQLAADEDSIERWIDLRSLPPAQYNERQWETLIALLQLLPVLVAHLQIIFQKHSVADYAEIAQSAITALGNPQAPTDLALFLDYRIQHILIDEFQDTSIAQFRLLEQLTSGWQNGDGRTLFIVGDPMQSIYRFRKAEVGLFLQARAHGINTIQLTPLTLTVNFRSQIAIVNWINQTFQLLMPQQENISTGAITYTPSIAAEITRQTMQAGVHLHPVLSNAEENQTIVAVIQNAYAENPNASVAILVRARAHLLTLLPTLKAAGIAYRAIEIETLADRPHIQDVFALTRALLHLGDRVAWLAILRAPWCGVELTDLHAIANLKSDAAIWECLQQSAQLNFNKATRQRLTRVINVLSHSLQQRQRLPFNEWIEKTWLALGGPACLSQLNELQDVQSYFKLLAELEAEQTLPDINALENRLKRLFAAGNTVTGNAVEIMTIHKAKGLEFDCVILPGLDRTLANDEAQLLLSIERATSFGDSDLLLAPIKSAEDDYDPIYQYLQFENKKRERHEMIRLLYVAATRAKSSLHLMASVSTHPLQPAILNSPPKNSLLAQLWPAIANQLMEKMREKTIFSSIADNHEIKKTTLNFKRLKSDWIMPLLPE